MCDHENREEAMVVVERDDQGTPTVWCDPCMVPLVKALNDGGLRTVASCCGHGKLAGTVILEDGRWIHIRQGTVVDGRWKFELPFERSAFQCPTCESEDQGEWRVVDASAYCASGGEDGLCEDRWHELEPLS